MQTAHAALLKGKPVRFLATLCLGTRHLSADRVLLTHCRAFAQELDFYNMQLDAALRKFQAYFRLPGEAQKIERLMEVSRRGTGEGRN